jgi:hypothetical protein
MKTNVNTDPRDYASEFTGKTSMKRFLLGLLASLNAIRSLNLSSQPSTALMKIIRRRGFFGYRKR